MSLLTSYKEGFVSQEDIVVYKKLKTGEDYIQECIAPNLLEFTEFKWYMKIDGNTPSYTKAGRGDKYYYLEAIIPSGTKFWIQDDLERVVSESLYSTTDIAEEGESNLESIYFPYCLDLLTTDGWRVSWSPEINIIEVKGIFVYNSDTISLENYQSSFSILDSLPDLPDKIRDKEMAEKELGISENITLTQ